MKTNSLAAQAAKIQGNASGASAANAPAKAEKKILPPSVVVGNMLTKYKDAIKQALPSVLTPERFTRIATNVIAASPKLMQAVVEAPQTLIAALMNCAQLGIEPNTPLGQGFILPYLNKDKATGNKVMQCQFQLG